MRRLSVAWLIAFLLLCISTSTAGGAQITEQDYARAEMFLPWNADTLVFQMTVDPHWIDDGAQFRYKREFRSGKEFVLIDCETGERAPAFDHERLSAALFDSTGEDYQPDDLPFDDFEYSEDRDAIQFAIDSLKWRCNLSDYQCTATPVTDYPSYMSPDSNWYAFVRDYNLWVRSVDSGEEKQLSFDGENDYAYATAVISPTEMFDQDSLPSERTADVIWSPDSKRIVTYRMDQRAAGRFHLVQSSPDQQRPRLYSYVYPLPGDTNVPLAKPVVFEVETGNMIEVESDPLPVLYYGDAYWEYRFCQDRWFYFIQMNRGYQRNLLREIDMTTGAVRTIVEETSETCVDPGLWALHVVGDGSGVIWGSERDGWNHLYLYDREKVELKTRLTSGQWVVRYIVHVDDDTGVVYFMASGRENGRDPYFRHLYRVNFDGTGLSILTPEDANHSVDFSPNGRFFIDTYSTVDAAPVSVLKRAADGSVVCELERANIELLLATGWEYPERFCVKGRDGTTDICGVIFRPSTFDSTKSYPVLDRIYTGPHSFFAPTSFWAYRDEAQSLAELGFIVVAVDGMGTGKRSKTFHDVSHKNLGDGGLEDHIAAMKQLAERYSYMDLDRVGVFGFSAGGYDAAHALLTHPEFYKVGVAASGNHDHRMDKAWWVELWMGYPVGEHYVEQSNVTLAGNLEGKLLLAHGELDENVHPASTMQLVDALIEANKDFDLLIMPNKGHYLGDDPYFIRKRWDYFIKHLHGVDPPAGYEVGKSR